MMRFIKIYFESIFFIMNQNNKKIRDFISVGWIDYEV